MQPIITPRLPRMGGMQAIQSHWPEHLHDRSSAVLLLFIPAPDSSQTAHIVFTRRSNLVRTHKGQIGFPGGRREPNDRHPSATALRETWEEIGLHPSKVTILGELPVMYDLDRRPIITIAGLTDVSLQELCANPDEVAAIFSLPWELFSRDSNQMISFNLFGHWRETAYFAASGYHIWGLTAMLLILAELE